MVHSSDLAATATDFHLYISIYADNHNHCGLRDRNMTVATWSGQIFLNINPFKEFITLGIISFVGGRRPRRPACYPVIDTNH